MINRDSIGPKGHGESKTVSDFEDVDKGKKRKNSQGSKTFVPAENDRKVTVEDFDAFVANDEKATLERVINAYCFKFSLDYEIANDICSQTLAEVLAAIHHGAVYESKFKGLLNTIAYRLVIKELKIRNKNGYGFTNSNPNSDENQGFDFDSLPERRRASPEVMACLRDAVEKLDSREQQVFILDHADFSDKEIAERLKTSEQNVRILRFRATKRLKE